MLNVLLARDTYLFGCGIKFVKAIYHPSVIACAFYPSYNVSSSQCAYNSTEYCNFCNQCKYTKTLLDHRRCEEFQSNTGINCTDKCIKCRDKSLKFLHLCSKLSNSNLNLHLVCNNLYISFE